MSPPASVTITQLEPVIFLRGQSSSGEDARGRRRPVNFDAPPSQLRALVMVHLPKPSKIKEISISLKGTARTDWPEGIGPNRVEMVEEMTIFQHSISLFNAKDANDSVPRARPRSNSVGPGIGLQEDVDWDYAAAAASARTSARQPSGSVPRPINTTGRRDEEGSKNSGSQGQSGSNLARQIALGAAKAGSAIIPPTLRPDLSHMKLRDSPTSPSHLRPPARPPLQRTGSGTTSWTSEQTSPDLEATSPRLSPTANFSGSWTRSGPSTNGSATSPQDLSRWHDYFESQGYERPPLYAPRSAPLQGYDSWPTELPSDASATAPQVAGPDSQAASSLGSVSSSAAPSTSTTPLDRSAANSAQGLARLNAALTAVAQPRSKFGAAVHSASPPSTAPGRSILHTQSPSAPRSKEQTVRFDPQSRVDNAAAAASNASNNKASGTRSNPSSRRSSMELDKNSLKGKSSSKAGHDTKGKKPGLKNLINGLLKEPAADSKTPSEEPALSDSKEFKKGTYTYPISISLPSNLPPTLHADFGFNRYILRAHVVRSGALTPNLVAEREVTLIHAPDEDALEETDAIVVERCWEDLLSYMVVFSGKSFPVGQKIPLWLKFVPLGKVKIYRILATLEERTDYFAKGRRVARHEVPRKWTLLKIGHTSSAEPILPVVSDSADALDKSPLAPLARAAANEDEDSDALASILDPTGPWELATELPIPAGASTRINLSTNHSKSNIAVHHLVRLSIRVGRSQGEWQVWSDGAANASSSAKPAPQLYDIIIEAPITLNHSHTASEWTALPNYWSLPAEPEDADSARASPERESAPTRPALPLPVLTSRTGLVGQSHSTTPSRAGPGGENSPTGSPPMSRNPTQLSRRWLALSADQNARDGSASAGSNGGSVPPPAYQANARTGERTVASTSMSRSPSTADTSEGAVRDATGPPASTQAANAVGMAH